MHHHHYHPFTASMVRRWMLAVLICLSCILARTVQAKIGQTYSIEWLTCSADAVVIGTVVAVNETKSKNGEVRHECVLQVQEMLKGTPAPQVRFRSYETPVNLGKWQRQGDKLLIFLGLPKADDASGTIPQAMVPRSRIIPLAALPKSFYNDEGKRIVTGSDLVRVIRASAHTDIEEGIEEGIEEEALWGSDAHKYLYSHSAVCITVPADEKHRLKYRRLAESKHPDERYSAAWALAHFPQRPCLNALRTLLLDESVCLANGAADAPPLMFYHVREAALRSLKKLGVAIPVDLPITRNPTDEEMRTLNIRPKSRS